MKLAVVAVAALLLQGAGFKATFVGGGHAPAINKRWPYTVKVTDAKGKPTAARITAVVVDPVGGVHPVEFFATIVPKPAAPQCPPNWILDPQAKPPTCKKYVTNYPIKGTFKDAIIWPPESGGYALTFKVTVRVGTAKKVLIYLLTPQLPAS